MRIGSPFNLPSLPNRPPLPPSSGSLAAPSDQASSDKAQNKDARAGGIVRADFAQQAEQAHEARTSFYSMEQNLPLSSREALAAYNTTHQFGTEASQGELVGVDLYI